MCPCIDPDDVPVGIWLVLLMSIRQLLSMNGVGGYLAHTAVVPSYLPPVSMATNVFLMRPDGTNGSMLSLISMLDFIHL